MLALTDWELLWRLRLQLFSLLPAFLTDCISNNYKMKYH
jgi:hypothetical protein